MSSLQCFWETLAPISPNIIAYQVEPLMTTAVLYSTAPQAGLCVLPHTKNCLGMVQGMRYAPAPDPNLIKRAWNVPDQVLSMENRPHNPQHSALMPDTTGEPQRSCVHLLMGQSQVRYMGRLPDLVSHVPWMLDRIRIWGICRQVDALSFLSQSSGHSWAGFWCGRVHCPTSRLLPLRRAFTTGGLLSLEQCLGKCCVVSWVQWVPGPKVIKQNIELYQDVKCLLQLLVVLM